MKGVLLLLLLLLLASGHFSKMSGKG